MPTGRTRFIKNWATIGALLKTPLPNEVAGFPSSNLVVRDRNIKWACAGAGGTEVVIVDIGTSKSVDVVGFMGIERAQYPSQFFTSYAATYPNPSISGCSCTSGGFTVTRPSGSFITDGVKVGQRIATGTTSGPNTSAVVTIVTALTVTLSLANSATATGTLTVVFTDRVDLPSTALTAPDGYRQLASPVIARYWILSLPFTFETFAMGKPLLGQTTDLGIGFSAGSSETMVQAKVHNRAANGGLLSTRVGPNRKRLDYQYLRITQTTKDALFDQFADTPVIIITPYDELLEVELVEDTLAANIVWGAPDLYDVTLSVESLP